VFGLIAAALGIDKYGTNESAQLQRFAELRVTVATLPRRDRRNQSLLIRRLEDYHTVTGIRRASGKVHEDATVQTYRHYLLDARFGVLLEGDAARLEEIANALRNSLGSLAWAKVLSARESNSAAPASRARRRGQRLQRAGYSGEESITQFDHVVKSWLRVRRGHDRRHAGQLSARRRTPRPALDSPHFKIVGHAHLRTPALKHSRWLATRGRVYLEHDGSKWTTPA
jgi:hypothetical protein